MYEADISFINGNIYSMEREGEACQAFSVRDNKIIAVGTTEEISRIHAEKTIDLHGKTVLPGMIDCHQHTYNYAQTLLQANLKNTSSVDEIQERLEKIKFSLQPGMWIKGSGFDEQRFLDKKLPVRADLDKVSVESPVIISRYCMHICVVNSKVLEMAGLDVQGDGIIRETDMTKILSMIPDPCPDKESRKNMLYNAMKEMISVGITGIHPIQGRFVGAPEYLNLYQELKEEDRLLCRVYASFDEFPSFSMKTGFGDEMLKYGFFKIYSDGSLGTRDAALTKAYCDAPGHCGILNYSQREITKLCEKAYEKDLQIGIHAIGDKGIEIAVGAFEQCYKNHPKKDVRFRLIHGTVMRPDLIERIKRLPVMVDIQPGYTSNTNIWWSIDRLGKDRLEWSYAWKKLSDAGILMTGSSDAPVEPVDPFWGIYSVVMRMNGEGKPEGGWMPQERLSVYEAVCLYTKNAAYSSYEENIKGTLTVGKLADFIVTDRDVFRIPPAEIKDTKVLETWLGGKKIYDRCKEEQEDVFRK